MVLWFSSRCWQSRFSISHCHKKKLVLCHPWPKDYLFYTYWVQVIGIKDDNSPKACNWTEKWYIFAENLIWTLNTRLNHKKLPYLTGFDLEKWSFIHSTYEFKTCDCHSHDLCVPCGPLGKKSCCAGSLSWASGLSIQPGEPWGRGYSLGNCAPTLLLSFCLHSPSTATWFPHVGISFPPKHIPTLFWIFSAPLSSSLGQGHTLPFPPLPFLFFFPFHSLCLLSFHSNLWSPVDPWTAQ